MAGWNMSGTFGSPQGAGRRGTFGDGPAIVLVHGTYLKDDPSAVAAEIRAFPTPIGSRSG